jgi:hypothetical protein
MYATFKGKVVLGLSKCHAMKTYPVLNWAPFYEDSGGIAPFILNLGTT